MNRRALYPFSVWLPWAIGLPLALIAAGAAVVATTSVEELPFDNADLWWLGAAGPVAGLIVLYGVWRRRTALGRFASAELAPLLAAGVSPARGAIKSALFITAVLMIVAAIIGPRWGTYLAKQRVRGVDVVVALDVSRSMLAQDLEPNRLAFAKREIRRQLTERTVLQNASRLALLAFAGSTSLKLPLTTDHPTFRTRLEEIHVGSAPRGGTAIGEAVRAAVDLFAASPTDATKVILLFTDGEDHEGGSIEAAKAAYEEKGIRVFAIGVGDPARTVGVQVPESAEQAGRPLLYDGQIVFSRMDVAGLQAIADAGRGRFAAVRELYQLVDAIANMHQSLLSSEERIRHQPRYQWFVAAALLLLGIELMISEQRSSVAHLPHRVWQEEAVA